MTKDFILLIAGTVQMLVGCFSVLVCLWAMRRIKRYEHNQIEFREVVQAMIENVRELTKAIKK